MAYDNIWFTYKARIHAHERLASNDFHTQMILVWYAVASVVLAICTIRYPTILGASTDLFSAVISVALLAISMLVTNRDFRGRSLQMRDNYLEMQALYSHATGNEKSSSDIQNEYTQLLKAVENHSDMDDKNFRVFQPDLTSRQATITEKIEVYAYIAIRSTCLTLAYVGPIFIAVFLYK